MPVDWPEVAIGRHAARPKSPRFVAFLLRAESAFINGADLPLDAGHSGAEAGTISLDIAAALLTLTCEKPGLIHRLTRPAAAIRQPPGSA